MTKVVKLKYVEELLKGIDLTETDKLYGWWETSSQAEAGHIVLQNIRKQALDFHWTTQASSHLVVDKLDKAITKEELLVIEGFLNRHKPD